MLKLKFYASDKLGSAETVIIGHTAYQVTRQIVDAIAPEPEPDGQTVGQRNGRYTARFRSLFTRLGLPTWGIVTAKMNQSSAWMLETLVKKGFAEWIKFDIYEFLPGNAREIIASEMGNTPKSLASRQKIAEKTRRTMNSLTPEQRAERSAKLKAGWAKRRAALAAGEITKKPRKPLSPEAIQRQAEGRAKVYEARRTDPAVRAAFEARHNDPKRVAERNRRRIEKQIAQGKRPAPGDIIQDWLELPDHLRPPKNDNEA